MEASSCRKGLTKVSLASFDRGWDSLSMLLPWSKLDRALNNRSDESAKYLHRSYISHGDVAHFEGGSELDLGDKFNVTASGYILPW
jgi:hypothetical protein